MKRREFLKNSVILGFGGFFGLDLFGESFGFKNSEKFAEIFGGKKIAQNSKNSGNFGEISATNSQNWPLNFSDKTAQNAPKIAVVYYTRTLNTHIVANFISQNLNAATFQIVPKSPYPSDYDLMVKTATNERRTGFLPSFKILGGNLGRNLTSMNSQNFGKIFGQNSQNLAEILGRNLAGEFLSQNADFSGIFSGFECVILVAPMWSMDLCAPAKSFLNAVFGENLGRNSIKPTQISTQNLAQKFTPKIAPIITNAGFNIDGAVKSVEKYAKNAKISAPLDFAFSDFERNVRDLRAKNTTKIAQNSKNFGEILGPTATAKLTAWTKNL